MRSKKLASKTDVAKTGPKGRVTKAQRTPAPKREKSKSVGSKYKYSASSMEDWIALIPEDLRDVAALVHRVITSAHPRVLGGVKWGSPHYHVTGVATKSWKHIFGGCRVEDGPSGPVLVVEVGHTDTAAVKHVYMVTASCVSDVQTKALKKAVQDTVAAIVAMDALSSEK